MQSKQGKTLAALFGVAEKNQEQIFSTLLSKVIAVVVWDVVIFLLTKLVNSGSNSRRFWQMGPIGKAEIKLVDVRRLELRPPACKAGRIKH